MNPHWNLHKDQWREYVIRHAKPHGLSEECLAFYDPWTEKADETWSYDDFAKMANDALWEWDI